MLPESVHRAALISYVIGFGIAANAQVPQRASATYDDWTASCVSTSASPVIKTCELFQLQKIQSRSVGQIIISRAGSDKPVRILFEVPDNVWLQTGIKLSFDDQSPGLMAPFTWCVSGRCLAESELTNAVITKLRGRTDAGRVEYRNATQANVSLPISFKGFGAAMDWIQKQ